MSAFVKPLWNWTPSNLVQTDLDTELDERRYATGRGLCITADTPEEARTIAMKFNFQSQGHEVRDHVQIVPYRHIVVMMAAPRW